MLFLIAVLSPCERKTDGKPIILVATRISRKIVKNPFPMDGSPRSFESVKFDRIAVTSLPVVVVVVDVVTKYRFLSPHSRIPRALPRQDDAALERPEFPCNGTHTHGHLHMFSPSTSCFRARNPTTTACILPRACARA